MRSFSTTIFLFLLSVALNAQNVNNQVICSAGSFNIAGNNSVSLGWTLGELIIPGDAGEGSKPFLAQGFQQSGVLISKVSLTALPGVEALLYPNPAAEIINISLSRQYGEETMVFMFAPDGRVIDVTRMEPGIMSMEINIAKYKPGLYFLKMQNGDKHTVYQFIKL